MDNLLIDHGNFVTLQLVEDTNSGKIMARGEFATCDEATANGRVYSSKLWEREIGKLAKKIGEKKIFGELDHPNDGKTQLHRVSHILTNLKVEGKKVIGEAEIVDTERGLNLKAILKAGGQVGVSSRGRGSTVADGKGREIVSEDYQLQTFDFVADPAAETAIPKIFSEEKQLESEMANLTLELLKEKHPDLVKAIEESAVTEVSKAGKDELQKKIDDLKEEFKKDLLAKIDEMKETAREEAKGELLSDPEVGRAKLTVDSLKELLAPHILPKDSEAIVETKNAEIAELKKKLADLESDNSKTKSELSELETISKKVGHRLYLEQKIISDENAAEIRSRLKDLDFESTDKIDEKIEETRELLKKDKDKVQEHTEAQEKLEKENVELKEALEKALDVGKEFGLTAYAEKRISGHPHAPKLRELMEKTEFENEQEVDQFITKYESENKTSTDFDRIRASISKANRHSQSGVIVEGSTGQGNLDGLGVSIGELKAYMPKS